MSQDYEKIKIHKRDIIGSRKVNSSINDFDYVLSKENPYDSEPSILCLDKNKAYSTQLDSSEKDTDTDELKPDLE
ncbi:hypothetical protein LUQ84_001964 [Hamiltosporidium tvaerminnensis]|nr:hypothetical protein LUQ84_001964 [Hamiltosporidium tvaerminnensis]